MADDPLEEEFIHICKMYKIQYTRPEREPENPSNLDFYLPHYNLFVEVKQFHTDRLCKQIEATVRSWHLSARSPSGHSE